MPKLLSLTRCSSPDGCNVQHADNDYDSTEFESCKLWTYFQNTKTYRTGILTTIPAVIGLIYSLAIIIRPRRSRSTAAYSDQTFPWTICRSVRRSVYRCVGLSSALWKNSGSDPDAVWHHRSDGSRDEAGSGVWGSVHGKGTLAPNLRRAIVTNGDFTVYVSDSAATRPSSQITLGRLVITTVITTICTTSVRVSVAVCWRKN